MDDVKKNRSFSSLHFSHLHALLSALFLTLGAVQLVRLAAEGIYHPSDAELYTVSLVGGGGMIASLFHRASHFGYLHAWSMRRSALVNLWLLWVWSQRGVPTRPGLALNTVLALLCAAANYFLEVRALWVAEPAALRRTFGTDDFEGQRRTAMVVNGSYFSFTAVVLAVIAVEASRPATLSLVACVDLRYAKQWDLFAHMALAAATTTAVGTFTGTLAVKRVISHKASSLVAVAGSFGSLLPLAAAWAHNREEVSFGGWVLEC